jgi:RNA polymerase sigma-70 factor (ECF subfamily)
MTTAVQTWETVRQPVADPFEALFLQEYPRVVAIARRVLGDTDQAEDVAQDVFVQFYRCHPPRASYAAGWLHAAAVHSALNVVRGNRRRLQREQREAMHAHRLQHGSGADLDPQRALEERERRDEVRAVLGRLPERSAVVLILRHSGLSYAEIGAALGVSPTGVGTLLRRAESAFLKEMTNATPE